jgi:hypothetical protein
MPDEPDQFTQKDKQAELDKFYSNLKQQKLYAKLIYVLTSVWVFAIFALLIFQGFQICGFHLSDSVILAAIGSTTADIVGVFLIVTRYVFSEK